MLLYCGEVNLKLLQTGEIYMKKILFSLIAMILFVTTANAESIIKSYYAYTIKDRSLDEMVARFESENATSNIKKLPGTKNAYFVTWNGSNGVEHYYVKLYAANKNTDMYIVSDADYDKDNNTLIMLEKTITITI